MLLQESDTITHTPTEIHLAEDLSSKEVTVKKKANMLGLEVTNNLPAGKMASWLCTTSKQGELVSASPPHPQEQLPEGTYWCPITPL